MGTAGTNQGTYHPESSESPPRKKASGLVRLVEWFIGRVIIPLAPLLVARLTDWLMGSKSVGIQDEKVLIYAFLLPLFYLQQVDHRVFRVLVGLASGLGLCLFGITYYALRAGPNPPDLGRFYHFGEWLCIVYVALATIYEIVRIYTPRSVMERQDTEGGGLIF